MRRHKDAVRAHEEAPSLYRNLAETDPTVKKYLAHLLRSIGTDLRNTGRQEDGVHTDLGVPKLK